MSKRYNEAEFLTLLRKAVAEKGSQRAFAEAIGISEPYLSDVLLGRRHASEKLLTPLGLRREFVYVKE